MLTKDNPTGDVVFGVDNTFAVAGARRGRVRAVRRRAARRGRATTRSAGDDDHGSTPVDNGNVCVNVDDTWFADQRPRAAETLDDLTDPAYQDLFVTPGATTSSPGLAFLLATIAEYGDDWPDYWSRLLDNGAKLTEGWTDAY